MVLKLLGLISAIDYKYMWIFAVLIIRLQTITMLILLPIDQLTGNFIYNIQIATII